MKNIRFLIVTLLSCLLGLFAFACNKAIVDYNVDFIVDDEIVTTVGTDGEKITMPANPSKENYTFDGWYWDEGEWEEEFTLNSLLDQPLQEENHYKVYAKWKGVDVTITYQNNGEQTKVVAYGADFELPVPNGEYGDVFLGWQISSQDETRLITDEKGKSVTSCDFLNATATPVWKEGKILLTLDCQGGVLENTKAVVWQGEPFGVFPTPIKEEYVFVGWALSLEEEKTIESTDTVLLTEDTTVYARWEKEQIVKISFDGNGATGTMAEYRASNTTFILPQNTFTTPGYIFSGWQCGDETYADGATVSLEYGKYTFTALWKGIEYTIAFKAGEYAEGSMPSQAIQNGKGQTLSLNTFTRTGYTFGGWEGADGKVYADGAKADFDATQGEEIVLTAKWNSINYYVYIKPNAETPNEECQVWTIPYDKQYLISTNQLMYKEGYKHVGWTQINGADENAQWDFNPYVFNLASEEGACIEFIPTWEPIKYDIKYKYFNGTYTSIQAIKEATYDEEHTVIDAPSFQRDGYVFAGWQVSHVGLVDDDFAGKIYQPGDKIKNLTSYENQELEIHAVWKEITYTVRLNIGDDENTVLEGTKTYKESLSIPLEGIQTRKENYTLEGFRVGHVGVGITWSDKDNGIPYRLWLSGDYCTEQDGAVDFYPIWRYNYQGSGTKEAPYIVDCADAMENMATVTFLKYAFAVRSEGTRAHAEIYFSFTADIDMTGKSFTPIGVYDNPSLDGAIYGNGHTVSALNICVPEDLTDVTSVGFVCNYRGEISNLRFVNSAVNVTADVEEIHVGFMTTEMYDSTISGVALENCSINVTNTGKVWAAAFQTKGSYGHEILKNDSFVGDISVTAGGDVKVGTISVYNGKMLACAAQAKVQVITSGKATLYGVGTSESKQDVYTVFQADVQASALTLQEAGSGYASNTLTRVYYSDLSSVTFNGEEHSLNATYQTADENLKNAAWVSEHLPLMRTTEWTMEKGYPQLGKRTLERVEITTKEQFLALSGKSLTESYVLTCDIDMTGVSWTMPSVYGEFDGNGHSISNYAVTDFAATSIGLFAYNYGVIKNLAVENVQILAMAEGNAVYLAGLVVENGGEVAYCKVSGSLLADIQSGNVYVGGIAAINSGGRIYCSYTDCTLEGSSLTDNAPAIAYVFGIAYNDGGVIEQCYTMGNLTAKAKDESSWGYTTYAYIGGVSNVATSCFSLANLTYEATSKKQSSWAVAEGLEACSSQTLNGVAQSGILAAFLKNEAYLTEKFGWEKFVSEEALKTDAYAAWKFSGSAYPTLYFE